MSWMCKRMNLTSCQVHASALWSNNRLGGVTNIPYYSLLCYTLCIETMYFSAKCNGLCIIYLHDSFPLCYEVVLTRGRSLCDWNNHAECARKTLQSILQLKPTYQHPQPWTPAVVMAALVFLAAKDYIPKVKPELQSAEGLSRCSTFLPDTEWSSQLVSWIRGRRALHLQGQAF